MNGPASRPVPVTFFLVYGYGTGGLPRTVFALADELHRRGHPVEVVSVTRPFKKPQFEVEEGVKVSYLFDLYDPQRPEKSIRRPRDQRRGDYRRVGWLERAIDALPSGLGTRPHESFSRLADVRLRRKMRSIQDGIVVTTRAEFGIAAARWTRPNVLRIHQEHLAFSSRRAESCCGDLVASRPGSTPLLALTEADAEALEWDRRRDTDDHRRTSRTLLRSRHRSGTAGERDRSRGGPARAAEGLRPAIDAYAPLAEKFPDWQVHIYGVGPFSKSWSPDPQARAR